MLDIDGIDASPELPQLPSRVQSVGSVRRGHPGRAASAAGMRIVLDLKAEVKPDVFALKPVAEYGHRLVLDLYPLVPLDPLMALLESERVKEQQRRHRTLATRCRGA